MKHPYQAYAAATQTVAETRQIVMLYDGIIRTLQQARLAMEAGQIEERYHLLVKASEIIYGLQSCLDFEKGGQIAHILYNFYSSVDARIFALHRTGSLEGCDEVLADIRQMRDVWNEIDTGNNTDSTAAEAPAPEAVPAQGALGGVTLSA